MLDTTELQILVQLIDNMDIVSQGMEKAYEKNDNKHFNKAKKEILDVQGKVSSMLKK